MTGCLSPCRSNYLFLYYLVASDVIHQDLHLFFAFPVKDETLSGVDIIRALPPLGFFPLQSACIMRWALELTLIVLNVYSLITHILMPAVFFASQLCCRHGLQVIFISFSGWFLEDVRRHLDLGGPYNTTFCRINQMYPFFPLSPPIRSFLASNSFLFDSTSSFLQYISEGSCIRWGRHGYDEVIPTWIQYNKDSFLGQNHVQQKLEESSTYGSHSEMKADGTPSQHALP